MSLASGSPSSSRESAERDLAVELLVDERRGRVGAIHAVPGFEDRGEVALGRIGLERRDDRRAQHVALQVAVVAHQLPVVVDRHPAGPHPALGPCAGSGKAAPRRTCSTRGSRRGGCPGWRCRPRPAPDSSCRASDPSGYSRSSRRCHPPAARAESCRRRRREWARRRSRDGRWCPASSANTKLNIMRSIFCTSRSNAAASGAVKQPFDAESPAPALRRRWSAARRACRPPVPGPGDR